MALLSALQKLLGHREQARPVPQQRQAPALPVIQASNPQLNEVPDIQGSFNMGLARNPQAVQGSYTDDLQPQHDSAFLATDTSRWNIPALAHSHPYSTSYARDLSKPQIPNYHPINYEMLKRR